MLNLSHYTVGDFHTLEAIAEDERKRQAQYKAAWTAYKGELPDALTVKAGQANDNVKVSKARVIVDTAVSFLFGQDITFELDATRTTPAEEWLDACWQANRKMTTLYELGINGAVCGHPWLKIARPDPLISEYPRLIVLDPANVTCTWHSEDIRRVLEYRIQWDAIDEMTRKPITRRQVIRQEGLAWVIRDYVMRSDWSTSRWKLIAEETWPWSWPPILDCQNIIVPNEYYGEPDIPDDIINLNKSINFNMSNAARIIKFQAHQMRWGKGFRADELTAGPDEMPVIDSETAEINVIPPVTEMTGVDTFGRRLEEAIHEASRTPAIATGKLENTGQLSGVALQILYGPLVQKTEAKRRTYGDMLVELNRRLLEMGGYGADNRPSIVWPEILPVDMQAERQSLTQDAALGIVSKETLATKLGYDWELEQRRMDGEGDGDETTANIPTQDQANALAAIFKAIKDGVDAGIDLEAVLKVSGVFTDAQISAIVAANEAEEEADALESQQRMEAMREGGMIGQPGQQQIGQPPTQTTGSIGGATDGG